jgi:hypothetical protein
VKSIGVILAVVGVVWASPDCAWAAQNEGVTQTGVAARVNGESVAQADVQRLLANQESRVSENHRRRSARPPLNHQS